MKTLPNTLAAAILLAVGLPTVALGQIDLTLRFNTSTMQGLESTQEPEFQLQVETAAGGWTYLMFHCWINPGSGVDRPWLTPLPPVDPSTVFYGQGLDLPPIIDVPLPGVVVDPASLRGIYARAVEDPETVRRYLQPVLGPLGAAVDAPRVWDVNCLGWDTHATGAMMGLWRPLVQWGTDGTWISSIEMVSAAIMAQAPSALEGENYIRQHLTEALVAGVHVDIQAFALIDNSAIFDPGVDDLDALGLPEIDWNMPVAPRFRLSTAIELLASVHTSGVGGGFLGATPVAAYAVAGDAVYVPVNNMASGASLTLQYGTRFLTLDGGFLNVGVMRFPLPSTVPAGLVFDILSLDTDSGNSGGGGVQVEVFTDEPSVPYYLFSPWELPGFWDFGSI